MPLSLRSATPADATIITEFNRRLAWESEAKTLDTPTLLAGVTACLNDPAKGFYTVAELNGEIVGQTLITLEWSDWRNGWFWWIQSVYVREDARGSGVFKALFEHLKQAATTDDEVIGLRLYVEAENAKAQAVYKKLGMTETGYGLLELFPLPV
ncbi:GNAT family N-acetyltransferase [soil metagenome]